MVAVFLLGGYTQGWSDAPGLLLVVLIGLIAAYALWFALNAASANPRTWLRSVWAACGLTLILLPCDGSPEAMFLLPVAMVLWLGIVAGWALFLAKGLLHVVRRSAPRAWSPRPTISLPAALAWTGALSAALLLLQLWPGVVNGLTGGLPAYALTLGSLVLGWAWLLVEPAMFARLDPSPPRASRRQLLAKMLGMVLALVTAALLRSDKLYRSVFALWREDFERIAPTVPQQLQETVFWPEGEGRWIGPWHVDATAADPRGGVYFRTWHAQGFMDITSFGFVQRPNQEGTPFGDAGYWLHSVSGDWWVFAARLGW